MTTANTLNSLPPGRFGLPLIGETLSFLQDPQFSKKRHQQYGPIFKTSLFGSPTVFVQGGEASGFVLANENKYFVTSLPSSTKALLGSNSISTQTGAKHLSRRKLLYQAFQPRALAEYRNTLEEITQRYLQKWAAMGTLTWYPELRSYTFDVACKFLIGLDFASQTRLRQFYETWEAGLFSFSPPLPWTKLGRALHSRKQLLAEIEAIIYQRQQQSDPANDALGLLLQARDEAGNSLPLDELKNQVLTILFAGHGTLASALASFCLLLAQRPEVLLQCRAEQDQFNASEALTPDVLKQMSYLDQVLQEVLRLIPPVGGGFRKVIRTCEFDGWRFVEGWNVIYEISLTHQDNSVYAQPDRFDPDRFSPKRAESLGKPFSHMPFGGGIRECLGKEFAKLEMKIFAALLVRHYTWELLPNQNLDLVMIPTPRPQDGLQVNFQPLQS